MKPPGKKVAVIGLGKSGFESAKLLSSKSFEVCVTETAKNDLLVQRATELKSLGISVELGDHNLEHLKQIDWVVVSPGIPPESPVLRYLEQNKIPFFSELEVASWFCPTKNIIAVTGTAGKTTVTTLLGEVLKRHYGHDKVAVCGNIGNPWIGELERLNTDSIVVLEASSFQLKYTSEFHPHVAVVLNLAPNHLDWHHDMKDYCQSKSKIFSCQTEDDHCFLREEDFETYFKNYDLAAKRTFLDVTTQADVNRDVVEKIVKLFNCSQDEIDEVFESFKGIEHRLEVVAEIEGVQFVNDSKCTTTASLIWALEKYRDHRVILIAGGKPKSRDYDQANLNLKKKTKEIIVLGEAANILRETWKDVGSIKKVGSLQEAVSYAYSVATAGDVVLLSPACASFDMFKNYEDRGQAFNKAVDVVKRTIKKEKIKS